MTAAQSAKTVARECIGYRIRMLNRMVSRTYDDALRPLGLRFSQMNILTVVVLRGPLSPSEVGKILSLEKSTLSRNVRVMVENGWLISRPSETGKGQLLTVTNEGEQLYQSAVPAWRKAQKATAKLLGDGGATAIRQAVDQAKEH